jgi:hypothetical protein
MSSNYLGLVLAASISANPAVSNSGPELSSLVQPAAQSKPDDANNLLNILKNGFQRFLDIDFERASNSNYPRFYRDSIKSVGIVTYPEFESQLAYYVARELLEHGYRKMHIIIDYKTRRSGLPETNPRYTVFLPDGDDFAVVDDDRGLFNKENFLTKVRIPLESPITER